MNSTSAVSSLQPRVVTQIPIALLKPDPANRAIDAAALKPLATDIAARGIELPIVVRADLQIKDGERRWRAAKLAGLETVPCLLAEGAENIADWRLDQVADNHHREPLNALDWAKVLHELVAVHGKPVGKIPALLKKRGIEMSRPYVSNLLRLNDLPDWAKALIARGVLPPAAGKYILMAAQHEPAMKKLRQHLETEAKRLDPGQSLRADLSWMVSNVFATTATELTANSWDRDYPRFAWKTSCAECKTRGQVEGGHFCFNRQCFDRKQAAADAAAKKKETAGPGKKAAAKNKITPAEARRRLQQKAQRLARHRAMAVIVGKAKGKPDAHDLRAMLSLIGYAQYSAVAERRGWKKAGNWFGDFNKRAKAMNAAELHGLLIEASLYYGTNDLTTTARRHGADLKKLEKAALAELKKTATAKPVAKPRPGKKKTAGKKKKAAKR